MPSRTAPHPVLGLLAHTKSIHNLMVWVLLAPLDIEVEEHFHDSPSDLARLVNPMLSLSSCAIHQYTMSSLPALPPTWSRILLLPGNHTPKCRWSTLQYAHCTRSSRTSLQHKGQLLSFLHGI